MKKFEMCKVTWALALCVCLSTSAAAAPKQHHDGTQQPLAWWQEARFGMFIHFGVYSALGRGEWIRSVERISVEAYQPAVDAWNPVAFDARALARLAKQAGMKYAVMTAKHHDGFCLFNSRLTDYKSTTTIKRDLIREFVDAFRAEGLRVGLYYSLLDWHHADYPHFGDKHHPMRDDAAWKDRKHDFGNYLRYMHGQVRELVSNYGRIDIFWFDFAYGDLVGDAWKGRELLAMVRNKQPHAIINNRLGGDGVKPGQGWGDFATPEQDIPAGPPLDTAGKPIPWETCITMNQSWGFSRKDNMWKSPRLLVGALINVVSKGGNLLLNVGPDGRGRLPEASLRNLKEIGAWLDRNGEAIYGAGVAEHSKPEWGWLTRKGNVLYAHVTDPPIGHLRFPGLWPKLQEARVLFDGSAAAVANDHWGVDHGDMLFVNVAAPTYRTFALPDPLVTVFALALKQ